MKEQDSGWKTSQMADIGQAAEDEIVTTLSYQAATPPTEHSEEQKQYTVDHSHSLESIKDPSYSKGASTPNDEIDDFLGSSVSSLDEQLEEQYLTQNDMSLSCNLSLTRMGRSTSGNSNVNP